MAKIRSGFGRSMGNNRLKINAIALLISRFKVVFGIRIAGLIARPKAIKAVGY